MTEIFMRRHDDGGKIEIDDLIKQENDPKTRAILLVLQNINISLMANTQAVNDTDTQLKRHMVEVAKRTEENNALLNKGRGMWNVISVCLAIVQAGLIYFMGMYLSDIKSLHVSDSSLDKRVLILEHAK
jgi:isocitrate lyase